MTSITGIAIGIATVLSIQVVDHNTILTQTRAQEKGVQPDVEIRPVQTGIPAGGATPDALEAEPDLADFCGIFFNRIQVGDTADRPQQLQICGLGPNASSSFDAYHVDEGRDFSSPTAKEVLVSRRIAESLQWQIGQKLTLQRVTRIREGCQDGEIVRLQSKDKPGAAQQFEIVGFLLPYNLGSQRLLVTPFESGVTLFEGSPLQALFWGHLREGAVFQDIRERLKASYVVEKPKLALVGERIDQRAFRKSIRVTSVLSLLLGLFVIYNAFSMALVERVREIGLLRALGLKQVEIVKAVLVEGALLAVGGGVAGLGLTAAVVAVMKKLQITTLGQGKPLDILEVPWKITAGVVVLGGVFAMFGMTAPLLRARHLSVVQALRAGRLALKSDPGFGLRVAIFIGVPVLLPLFYMMATPPLGERQDAVFHVVLKIAAIIGAFFLTILLFPGLLHRAVEWLLVPFRSLLPIDVALTRAAIRGSRLRVLGTLTGLAVVVAAIFCVREVNNGFLREMSQFSDRAMTGRVYIHARETPLEAVQKLTSHPDIERIYSLSAEIHSPFPIRGVRIEDVRAELGEQLDPKVIDDFTAGETLLMSQFLADSFGYRVGDEVRLPTFSGAQSFRVGAITDWFGYFPDDRNFALMEAQRLEKLFCVSDASGTRYVAELTAGGDADGAIEALSAGLNRRAHWIRSDATIKGLYLGDRRRDFWVFDVILWLIAALATIGLLNSLAIALLERRREIGLLRTIGLTPTQVGRLLLLESLAVGTLGGVLAACISVPLSKYALDGVRIISRLELSYEYTFGAVALPVVSGIVIAFAGALWPAIRSGQLKLGALARYE